MQDCTVEVATEMVVMELLGNQLCADDAEIDLGGLVVIVLGWDVSDVTGCTVGL